MVSVTESSHAHTGQPMRLPRLPSGLDLAGAIIGKAISYLPVILLAAACGIALIGGGR